MHPGEVEDLGAYRVALTQRVRDQLDTLTPELRGYLAGLLSLLRQRRLLAAVAAATDCAPDVAHYRIILIPGQNLPGGRGLLVYHPIEEHDVVLLLDVRGRLPADLVLQWPSPSPDGRLPDNGATRQGRSDPVVPTAEQFAAWRELIERVRAGDETRLLDWDEVIGELGLPG